MHSTWIYFQHGDGADDRRRFRYTCTDQYTPNAITVLPHVSLGEWQSMKMDINALQRSSSEGITTEHEAYKQAVSVICADTCPPCILGLYLCLKFETVSELTHKTRPNKPSRIHAVVIAYPVRPINHYYGGSKVSTRLSVSDVPF